MTSGALALQCLPAKRPNLLPLLACELAGNFPKESLKTPPLAITDEAHQRQSADHRARLRHRSDISIQFESVGHCAEAPAIIRTVNVEENLVIQRRGIRAGQIVKEDMICAAQAARSSFP